MQNSFHYYIDKIGQQLKHPLPGVEAQFKMAHVKRVPVNWETLTQYEYKNSAVLIFIYPSQNDELSLLLIQRQRYNGPHSAQIALPGGKTELQDVNLEATAIREFKEETGCLETPIIIGKCTPVYIPVSQFVVHPFVGYLNEKPLFNQDKREVEQLIECSFITLLNPSSIKETVVNPMPNVEFKTPYFDIDNNVVWGATAMILNEFKEIISKVSLVD